MQLRTALVERTLFSFDELNDLVCDLVFVLIGPFVAEEAFVADLLSRLLNICLPEAG